MIDWLGRFGAMLNVWVNTIRATNMKAVVTMVLYLGTYAVWAGATLRHTPIDLAAFGAWLAFCAALGGFSLAQFNTERKTDYGYLEKVKPAPSTVVNTTGDTKVTGAPVVIEATPTEEKQP